MAPVHLENYKTAVEGYPFVLNSRLKDLRDAEIVEKSLDGYILTERGKALRSLIVPLADWSANLVKRSGGL